MQSPDETKPILEQLSEIVEQVTNDDQETNEKLMEWSEKKFQGKVNEKISSEITLSQVELTTKIEKVKKVIENIFSLYMKLCHPTLFTQETSHRIQTLEGHMKLSGMQLPKDPVQSEKHFNTVLHTQNQLAMLIAEETSIRAKLIDIQASLTSHMAILQKELAYAKTMIKKDPNLSTLEGLVHLAAESAIQIKSLDVALDNWDVTLKVIMEVHKSFLDKYTICV